MIQEDFKRKLTAVFIADVAGYSRLMVDDEAATVKTLEAYKEIIFASIKQHRGLLIDSPGDNLLAEFASVVDAAQCAVAVQKELQARNVTLPENRKMRFRIGINLGDVIEEQGRIYGDGVNIAARLEALADPGGICISRTVFDHVEGKLPFDYEYIGEQALKNIAKPIPAYKVLMGPRAVAARAKQKSPTIGLRGRRRVLAVIAAIIAVIVAHAVWKLHRGGPGIEPPSIGKMTSPLPDKQTVAVLPFANLSGDPNQEYLSDGLTEDLITALSAIPRLLVIARNSTFTYKGKPVNVQQAGRELGARYILEGSIQTAGDRVRIAAQLIDADTGNHLWAERYDRELKDIFSLQDEITLKIIRSLQATIGEEHQRLATQKAPKSLDAYLKVLKGRAYLQSNNREDNRKARQLFEEAIALDQGYSAAHLLVARTHLRELWLGWSRSPEESLAKVTEVADKALALDPSGAGIHALLSQIHLLKGQYDKAIAEGERAISLSPGSVDGYISLGMSLYYTGKYEEAAKAYKEALSFDPTPPARLLANLGNAHLMMGQYKEAEAAYKQALLRSPRDVWAHVGLAAMYSLSGREKEARGAAAEVLEVDPLFSLEHLERMSPYRNQSERERLTEALRKAGLT